MVHSSASSSSSSSDEDGNEHGEDFHDDLFGPSLFGGDGDDEDEDEDEDEDDEDDDDDDDAGTPGAAAATTGGRMMIPSPPPPPPSPHTSSSSSAAAAALPPPFLPPPTSAPPAATSVSNPGLVIVPHRGSLCRIDGQNSTESSYILEILLNNHGDGGGGDEDVNTGNSHNHNHSHSRRREQQYELVFARKDFDFCHRLFTIMDTESRGQINKPTVQEFVLLRCPVFFRRDEDLLQRSRRGSSSAANNVSSPASISLSSSTFSFSSPGVISPTFEEIWRAVAACSVSARVLDDTTHVVEIGLEGWMVMCRFIAVAQYLEAKRRFSGRHLQQTMRHRNAPRGSELVMVDVPPPAPPTPLTASELANYEQENKTCLPLPELDLDHSLVAAHDVLRRKRRRQTRVVAAGEDGMSKFTSHGHVKIDLFGSSPLLMTSTSSSSSSSQNSLEFCLTYVRRTDSDNITDTISVRRTMKDMKWLNETFISQKALGGTLCGRILPPFPGNRALVASSSRDNDASGASGAIAAAANAGVEIANAGVGIASASVGMLKQGFKSLWGGSSSSSSPKMSSTLMMHNTDKSIGSKISNHTNAIHAYYNPNSPSTKARHLERYFNYMLEHPALSTSFSLQAILKASQSGLEAAKQSLAEHTQAAKEIKAQTPQMDDGKTTTFWSLQGAGSSMQPNLPWVRTAAQAAVALQLHGILETTGLPSASARLQHASLPSFDNARNSAWSEDDGEKEIRNDSSEDTEHNELTDSFEEGVMHVQDELEPDNADPFLDQEDDTGYDLLPLPVPAPERQILNVGETKKPDIKKESRYRYGSPTIVEGLEATDVEDEKQVYIGEMAIDENIDKLREVIGSVDNILSRCMASSGSIERCRRERLDTHLKLLVGLDSWEGLRGMFVNQRSLLKGVSGIEQSREVWEESDLALMDDITWQTALAHSAVSASEDVRSTVRAARTASNAKSAATSAAQAAQAVCEKGKFSNIDEARAARTRSSIAQSHAIHAAVVEHEATTVKRRATLALAHDVKCWNAHRKREVLAIALSYAKSQHEATRRSVDAWSCLRDGFVGSSIIPSTQIRKPAVAQNRARKPKFDLSTDEPPTTTIFRSPSDQDNHSPRPIVASDHNLFRMPSDNNSNWNENHETDGLDCGNINSMESSEGAPTRGIETAEGHETFPPFAVASPILDDMPTFSMTGSSIASESFGVSLSHHSSSHATLLSSASVPSLHNGSSISGTISHQPSTRPGADQQQTKDIGGSENEVMTSSMQSLVDGLMNWGGVDIEEDFALPAGMAASIAMEESVYGSKAT
mmetsp:Transcript_56373/g.136762  ORF Transcript_56373/g.136762 Transcript_56373/m.136762 type:complete len:1304 (+) Transcript_56373:755-4666(+)